MVVNSASQPCFRFIGMSVVGLAIGLSGAKSLAIGGTILTGADVAIGFSELFLW